MTIFLGGLYLLLIFNGAIFNLAPLPDFCGLWDEAITVLLILLSFLKLIKKTRAAFY